MRLSGLRHKRWPIDHALQVSDAALNITFACDLACVGCNRACFVKPPHTPAMTLERLAGFFDEARSLGISLNRLRIIGGEPTLHPQFTEIVDAVFFYARGVAHRCRVRLYSNEHSPRAKGLTADVRRKYPKVRLFSASVKSKSIVFPPLTRHGYVSPRDAGIDCPWPCPIMGGRGRCGFGVDQLGYSLCPMAGTIDSLLGLGARASRLSQLLDEEFVRWQAERICGHCGNFISYRRLPRVWDHNGTSMSETYHLALLRANKGGERL